MLDCNRGNTGFDQSMTSVRAILHVGLGTLVRQRETVRPRIFPTEHSPGSTQERHAWVKCSRSRTTLLARKWFGHGGQGRATCRMALYAGSSLAIRDVSDVEAKAVPSGN